MNTSTTLRLLLAVCLLGALLWTLDREESRRGNQPVAGMKILNICIEDVTEFHIVKPDFSADFVRRDDGWFITKPVASRANLGEVDRILDSLERMTATEVLTREQIAARQLSLNDYGLEKPATIVRLRTHSGTRSLRLGNTAELGNSIYTSLDNGSAVYITDSAVTSAIPANISSIRDRTLFSRDTARVMKIELTRPDGTFVRLFRNADGWILQQPMNEKADDVRVSLLLQSLYSVSIRHFVWDAKTEPETAPPTGTAPRLDAEVVPYGLSRDDAAAHISLWYAENESPVELSLGKETPDDRTALFAMIHGIPSVFTLPKSCLDILGVNLNELRDRAIFRFNPDRVATLTLQQGDHRLVLKRDRKPDWSIVEPIQWKAAPDAVANTLARLAQLKIAAFIDRSTLDATDLSQLGLAPGSIVVQLTELQPDQPENTPQQPPVTHMLHVGNTTDDGELLYARRDSSNSCFYLRSETASFLFNEPTDPLVYCDRTILSIKPESVRSLTLAHPAGIQSATRADPTAPWRPTPPATNLVDASAVQTILATLSQLRANRIVSHGASGVAAFGLDTPTHVLTLGLTGEAGIRKALLIGNTTPQGTFAQVQGQDIVFALPSTTLTSLTNGFLKDLPPPTPPPPAP